MARDKYVKLISTVSFFEEDIFVPCQSLAFGKLTKQSVSCLLNSRFHSRYSALPRVEVKIDCDWEIGYTVYAVVKDGVILKHPQSEGHPLPILVHITMPVFNSLMLEGPISSVPLRFVQNNHDIVLVSQKMIQGLLQRSEQDYVEKLEIGSYYLVEDMKGPYVFLGPNENLTYNYWMDIRNRGNIAYVPASKRALARASDTSLAVEEVDYIKLYHLKGLQTEETGSFASVPWQKFWELCPFVWQLSSLLTSNVALESIELRSPATSWGSLLDVLENCASFDNSSSHDDLRQLGQQTCIHKSSLRISLLKWKKSEWMVSLYGIIDTRSYLSNYILNCSPLELKERLASAAMPDSVSVAVFMRGDGLTVPCV
jgi:hypothetical protein